jgi:DNA-directed RNA polymerase II subunit RPB1
MGIVQDSLLGTMLFTLKDTFIELDILMQLLMWVNYDGTIPHPTIIKPKPLWTGKQIFSLIIPNINL